MKGHDEVELYMFRCIYSYRSPALSLFSKIFSFCCTYWALAGFHSGVTLRWTTILIHVDSSLRFGLRGLGKVASKENLFF